MSHRNKAEAHARTTAWHALEISRTAELLDADLGAGLSDAEAASRLVSLGANTLKQAKRRTLAAVFFAQFKSPLVYLLLLAGAVAWAIGERIDALVILAVVLLNATIGAAQEGRAERALAALRQLSAVRVRVLRGALERSIAASELVPGDLMLLVAGDAITADARLVEAAALQVAEAALTGESMPVLKSVRSLSRETPLPDRTDMVHSGSYVTGGHARALVVLTGEASELGRIAQLARATADSVTPLERKIAAFGRLLLLAAAGLFALVLALGLFREIPLAELSMIAVSQVVGLIPEGLPVAMTIALAIGVQRMAARKALVRRLAAVETLGSTTVICTDKTGTLTRNEMTVTAVALPSGRQLSVSGAGYAPTGEFLEGASLLVTAAEPMLVALLEGGALCNDAELVAPSESEPRWRPLGDPTEAALLTLAAKAGLDLGSLRAGCPRRAELPFDPDLQMMATQHDSPDGPFVIVKGAPEAVFALVKRAHDEAEDAQTSTLRDRSARMAEQALRVLAVACAKGVTLSGGYESLRGHLQLVGLVGQLDPPRAEVPGAIARCRAAGIQCVMVTGDHKATAHAIANALGIANPGDEVVDGQELARMSDQELAARIAKISVFARVQPAQKLRIVAAYQKQGAVVAMTGDGVNDAPALMQADVGVAMGSGTEVAKEAAKIVVADDNFATIVSAVEDGRVVYRNIIKAVLLLLSTSVAEVLVLLLALLFGYSPPFSAVQILWNNLVTEGVITVNLVMEPAEGDEMDRKPVSRDEPLLTRRVLRRGMVMSLTMVLCTFGWFIVRTAQGIPVAEVRTETFTLMAACEWFNVLNCRSETRSAIGLSIRRNLWLLGGLLVGNILQMLVVFWRPLGQLFHTVPIELPVVLLLGLAASSVLWVEELRKLFARRAMRALVDSERSAFDLVRAQT